MALKNIIIPTLLVTIILLILYGAFIFFQHNTNTIPEPGETITKEQTEAIVGLPMRLIIPSINVDAPVINVGLTKDGAVDVPKGPSEVAWYQLGPRPGEKGSSVITGHFGPWRTGEHSVFDNLNKLKTGDTIQIKDDRGNIVSFKVRETKMYEPNDSPSEVFNKNDGIYLNLITCQGEWLANQKTYTERLVVFTELVK